MEKLDIYEGNSLGIGAICALGGLSLLALLPTLAVPACGLLIVGGACVADYISHYSIFDQVFKGLKLGIGEAYPILKHKDKKEGYILYEFTLPSGLSVDDFIAEQLAIEQYIGKPIEISYGFKNLIIKVFVKEEITFYEFSPVKLKGDVELIAGYSRVGELVTIDLSGGEPHLLCAGESGGGKSNWIDCVLTNVIVDDSNKLDLYLIDLKNGAEFSMFMNCKKVKGFARNEGEAVCLLKQIETEVDYRYDLLFKNRVRNIKEYNKKFKPLKHQLLVIDEFAMLKGIKDGINIIERLSGKARACGIHILLLTQRPSADVVTGLVKANIPVTLGLKTVTAVNSQIIIGKNGLEKLRGKGHGILKQGLKETYIQIPYLSDEEAERLLEPFRKPPTDKPEQDVVTFDCLDDL